MAPITSQNSVDGLYGWTSPFIRAAAGMITEKKISDRNVKPKDGSVALILFVKRLFV